MKALIDYWQIDELLLGEITQHLNILTQQYRLNSISVRAIRTFKPSKHCAFAFVKREDLVA